MGYIYIIENKINKKNILDKQYKKILIKDGININ
jgi:hypothetical protein